MTKQPDQNDDDLRALLGADTAEPPATLDARILAAARAARQARPAGPGSTDTHKHGAETGPHKRGRPWYLPAGLGAAAAALIAVLMVGRAPDVSVGPGASPPPQLTRPEAPTALAQDAQNGRFAATRERAMLQEFAADVAPAKADPARAAAGPASAQEPASAEEPAPDPRQLAAPAPAPTCPASATPQSGEGLLLCLTPLHVEIHDRSAGGCTQPLVLARSAGNVSLARDGQEVIIRVDGMEQWRVKCTAGTWAVRAAGP